MSEFVDALTDLLETKRETDKAHANCDGSWGYYGFHDEEQLKKAKSRFLKAFRHAVREVIDQE